MRVPFLFALLLPLAVASFFQVDAKGNASSNSTSELVLVVSLSRHGSRAPNPSVLKHCPNNAKNLHAYAVPPEQLTERGMEQMEEAGRHVRKVYVDELKFLSPSFNSDDGSHFETYFRADAAQRCGQSAIAFGYGLYPDGTGPAGYKKQPIPVFMQLWESETDFTANLPCFTAAQTHATHYAETRGLELMSRHTKALDKAAEICGTRFFEGGGSGQVLAMKDVADMFEFDREEGFKPTPGLTQELTDELSQLAFQNLLERLFSTPREITTEIAGFPSLLVRTLTTATTPHWRSATSTKYFSFHGHRELLHGLGLMLGMKFNFGDHIPSFNGSTALHPGTTLFFELHRDNDIDANVLNSFAQYTVKLFVWSPLTERTPVKLDACALACPLADFTALIAAHIAQTGTWQEICNYHPVNGPASPTSAVSGMNNEATAAGAAIVPESPSAWPPLPAPSSGTHAAVNDVFTMRGKPNSEDAAVVQPAEVATVPIANDGVADSGQLGMQAVAVTVCSVAVLAVLSIAKLQRRRTYASL